MDEVNLDEFLREMSDAIDDPEKLSQYIREKATIAVERFLVSCAVGDRFFIVLLHGWHLMLIYISRD